VIQVKTSKKITKPSLSCSLSVKQQEHCLPQQML